MAPALQPGDRLVVESWTFRRRPPRTGDLVLAADPRQPSRELVKRVAEQDAGWLTLRSDAPGGSGSEAFGPIPTAAVRWRVALRYWPIRRLGRP